MRAVLLSIALVMGCDRAPDNATRTAGKLLEEDVLCSGSTNGCAGGGEGYTCVGRHTGREVYCSSGTAGRCVIVHGKQFGNKAEQSCATTATGEICRERP